MPHTPLLEELKEAVSVAKEASARRISVEEVLLQRNEQRITRRQFLQRSALLAASVALPSILWQPDPVHAARKRTSSASDIVIIGAGLAGLTCAYRLKQRGILATVYEASNRIGGRCWTRRGDFADGQIAEHGGELIDQGHTQIRQLAQDLGLDLDNLLSAEKNGTEPLYYFNGTPYSYAEATNDIKDIWQKMHRDLSEAGYPTLYNSHTRRGKELDHLSIIDWINETVPGGMDSKLGKLLDVAYTIEYGGEASDQSSLNLLYLLGYSGQGQLRMFGPSNEKYHVRGGNDLIAKRLGEKLEGQINTGMQLESIRQNSDGRYTLSLAAKSGSRDVIAEKVVLALPFSILRHTVDYSRAGFRDLKATAIEEYGVGTNSKLHVQFADRHWHSLGCNGDTMSETGYQNTWEVSRGQSGTSGILVNYTGGQYGDTFGDGTPESLAEQFLQKIEPVLPGLSEKWNGKATIDYWPGYKWTKGSYAYYRVGQYTKFAGIEREREGNCFFAGDHVSIDFQGYLNGAVESGENAAAEIAAEASSIRKQKTR